MPKIAAPSIDEHVRQQRERITAAARQLFAENGFARTDMGEIALVVGLKRNSLYRYYPNKEHILIECIRSDMEPYLEQLESLAHDYPDPSERIMRWLDMQFDMATGPTHATLQLMSEVREVSATLGKQVRRLHEAPNTVLEQALNDAGHGDVAATRAAMIGGMVLAATAHALTRPRSEYDTVRHELALAVACLI